MKPRAPPLTCSGDDKPLITVDSWRMKKTLGLLSILVCAGSPAVSEIPLELDAWWQAKERAGYNWAKVVNFTGETVGGTDTALIMTCLEDDPLIMVQHGEIDDDDLTWDERGTDEDVVLSYSIDGAPMRPLPGFLDGLDSSHVFLSPEDEPAFIAEILASETLSFDIAPATFDRPDAPVTIHFYMEGALEEIGETLRECGIGG
ncbi:MAG: hypothetical protein CMK07_12175 [Ponticaulis sp.]|nr:hypothetical protein [Ponticaulis sp.]